MPKNSFVLLSWAFIISIWVFFGVFFFNFVSNLYLVWSQWTQNQFCEIDIKNCVPSKWIYKCVESLSHVYKIESCNLYSIVHHGTRLLFLPPCSCTPSLCWRRHNNWITLQHNYKIAFCLQHFSLSERSQIHVLEKKWWVFECAKKLQRNEWKKNSRHTFDKNATGLCNHTLLFSFLLLNASFTRPSHFYNQLFIYAYTHAHTLTHIITSFWFERKYSFHCTHLMHSI